ncbi:ABC transporter G family member 15-like [Prunus yedoensis var. nudiflora]|uniref:ABC transporter G family member 15-like n=1 Tax=Prunus yedoensis var. nudiflora TaxID=2094558 RepID=A0A314XLL7_PRUYE|nr:ABC transporter G family member 15-like [Prunus yedoensis var. nudiflora]
MMPSLLFRRLVDLPKIFSRYPMSYLSYAAWSIQGQFKNDMIGLEFDPQVPGEPKLKGEDVLLHMYGINPKISKWWDLAALAALLYAKANFLHKAKRAPLRKEPLISSKRQKTLNPLASQEGLGSPLP